MPARNNASALGDQLAQFLEAEKGNHTLPDGLHEAVTKAVKELRESKMEQYALGVGDKAPDFELPDQNGNLVCLSSLLKRGPAVLNFYRGGWCPFCNFELMALQRRLPEISALGAQLIAISPEMPESSLDTARKNETSFTVLSDVGNRYADSCGLMYRLPEYVLSVYGPVLARIMEGNGDDSLTLPIPATYVVKTDGEIGFAYVNVDHRKRCEPQAIVDSLQSFAAAAQV